MEIAGVQLGVFDLISLGILLIFFVLGIVKGFAMQVVRLATFVVALFLAKQYAGTSEVAQQAGAADVPVKKGLADVLMNWFPKVFQSKEFAVYVAYFLIFVAVFILGTLIAFMLRAILKRLELRSYDRILGGLLGFVVGAVVIVVVVSVMASWLPNAEVTAKMKNSHTFTLSSRAIKYAEPLFPKELVDKINEALKKVPDGQAPGGESGASGGAGSGK